MTTQASKADHFHRLHVAGDPLVLFNVWDAGSTKAVAAGGARAIATGSWSVAAANGFADGERVPIDDALANLKRIVGVTALPVTVDLESGYGTDPDAVGRTITRAIDAGAIGCNLEDSFPHDGSLRPQEEQSRRIAAARAAADAAGIRFFINARTDVFMLAKGESHDEALVSLALERAAAYAAHGADGLFVPGLIKAGPDRADRQGVPPAGQRHDGRRRTIGARTCRSRRGAGQSRAVAIYRADEATGGSGKVGTRLESRRHASASVGTTALGSTRLQQHGACSACMRWAPSARQRPRRCWR